MVRHRVVIFAIAQLSCSPCTIELVYIFNRGNCILYTACIANYMYLLCRSHVVTERREVSRTNYEVRR